jgi:hypothetical protein
MGQTHTNLLHANAVRALRARLLDETEARLGGMLACALMTLTFTTSHRPPLTPLDRALWAWLSHAWDGWKTRLCLVQPGTVTCGQWSRRAGPDATVAALPATFKPRDL